MTILIVLLAAAALVLGISWGVYRIAFYAPDRTQNDDLHIAHTPQMDALREEITRMVTRMSEEPFERVYAPSEDGLRLAGRYYHRRDGGPLALCFHGWRGTPCRDFSGGTQLYFAAGFNVLMAEQRAQCGSEGNTMTFGVKERRDCLVWIRYALERFGPDTEIVLTGISMGASTVLMASALDLPENVKGIVADCPYTTPRAILRKVSGDWKVPADLAWPFLRLGARIFGGFDPADPSADAAAAVKQAKVPILLIHGEDDRFVPCDMGREIAGANPARVELHTFPEAGHGLSFLIDEPRYAAIVRSFLDRVTGRSTEAEEN